MDIDALNARVWEEMVYANMRANYFGDLIRTYQERDKWFRIAGFFLSAGSVATALQSIDPKWRAIVPLIATAGSAWALFSQYSTLSRDASDLMSSWQGLATRYEKLWNNLDAPNAEATFDQIYEEADRLSKPAGKFPQKGKRLNYWFDRSAALLTARYGATKPATAHS